MDKSAPTSAGRAEAGTPEDADAAGDRSAEGAVEDNPAAADQGPAAEPTDHAVHEPTVTLGGRVAANDGGDDGPERTGVTVAASDSAASLSRSRQRRARRTHKPLPAGALIGRYVVLERIAVGGMGAVYKAYDPKLDRKVAVKLVATGSEASEDAAERLAREAKALAQLSHPNVVAVYDVGSLEDDVFVAMALVEGQTLRAWIMERARTCAEVVEVFLAAGRGLAAAHGAGLVHRDFKPDNVLIGDDGRVQVVDFGIARAAGAPETVRMRGPRIGAARANGSENQTDGDAKDTLYESVRTPISDLAPLTQAGALVGTPTYMSPEQFRGEPVDAKSDQFSFCVALYDSLFGHRPFRGGDLEELKRNVVTGSLRPPDPNKRVPNRLRRIVERGLSLSPAERYESMDALLAELGKDPRALVRRVGVVAGVAAAIALTAFVTAQSGAAGPPLCKGARDQLAGHWDDGVRARARGAFIATEARYAEAAFERAQRVVDEYANGWVRARTQVCEATHVHGTQSAHLLDLRMRCLNRKRDALSSLGSVFADEMDAATVEEALHAALSLPAVDDCFDDAALEAAVPPPDDPAVRAAVESYGARLSYARALEDAGRYVDGLGVVAEIAGAVDATKHAPLQAELRFVEGRLQFGASDGQAAEAAFRASVVHGARAQNDTLIADAWVYLMLALDQQGELDTGLGVESVATVAVLRAGDKPLQQGRLREAVGRLHYEKGDFDVAVDNQERALALLESALGGDHPEVATVLGSLGATYYRQGDHARARDRFQRSLDIRERVFGNEHPIVARSVYRLAIVAATELDYKRSEELYRRALELFLRAHGEEHAKTALVLSGLGHLYYSIGRHAESEDVLRRSVAIREKLLGPDHPRTGSSLAMLGTLLNKKEDYPAAEEVLGKALAIWEAKLGPSHTKLAYPLEQLAVAHVERGSFTKAEPYYRRALDIRTKAFGEQHRDTALGRVYLAEGLARVGRTEEALRTYDQVIATYEALGGPDEPAIATALAGRGEALLALGRPDEARQALERSVAIRDAHQLGDPYPAAQTDFALARALWSAPEQRARAADLATRAHAVFAADPRPSADDYRERVDRWLASHRP